jgi:26S proteasome regulatory subunit, ATPase 3, interacting protein
MMIMNFSRFWHMATDALAPQAASELAEDLGIEYDTTEHSQLERTCLCDQNLNGRR